MQQMRLNKPLKGLRISYVGTAPVAAEKAQEMAKAEYKRGYQKAREFYERQIAGLRQEAAELQQQVLDGIRREMEQLKEEVNYNMPDIVMAVVRKIWTGLELDEKTLSRMIDEVLDQLSPGENDLEIFLCPADYGRLLNNDAGVSARYPGLKIVEDKALQSGDIALRSRFGHVDARVKTKFRKLCDELKGL
ncbi:MAG: hypothetical protein JW739_03570 [Opitutales bacterium]|nr:hypothetical protein [Opitutales bacterium]